eukprot:12726828-Alexandrium_andersonii.AAC.1
MLAHTSEEDFKQAIAGLGFYVDRSGEHDEFSQIGLMGKGRLLEFRAWALAAYEKPQGIRGDAPQ